MPCVIREQSFRSSLLSQHAEELLARLRAQPRERLPRSIDPVPDVRVVLVAFEFGERVCVDNGEPARDEQR